MTRLLASYDALEASGEAGEQAHPDDDEDAPTAGEARRSSPTATGYTA